MTNRQTLSQTKPNTVINDSGKLDLHWGGFSSRWLTHHNPGSRGANQPIRIRIVYEKWIKIFFHYADNSLMWWLQRIPRAAVFATSILWIIVHCFLSVCYIDRGESNAEVKTDVELANAAGISSSNQKVWDMTNSQSRIFEAKSGERSKRSIKIKNKIIPELKSFCLFENKA